MMRFQLIPYKLLFKFRAGTSRGVLTERKTWFIKVFDDKEPQRIGWGEAAPLQALSVDDVPDFEEQVMSLLREEEQIQPQNLSDILSRIAGFLPSLKFGMETAWLDWENGGKKCIYKNEFYELGKPLPINGLIWMGDKEFMLEQIKIKLEEGYACLKMKIGAIDFDTELELIKYIRSAFGKEDLILRVDANGAFSPENAIYKLEALALFDIHSIEQPIKAGQIAEMARICRESPLDIALDEELIGVHVDSSSCHELLDAIKPQYVILKPTLVGGMTASETWIAEAEKMGIGWWMTSALESNVGLNAIAQFTAKFNPVNTQGLGTGQLFHNNIGSPLVSAGGWLHYNQDGIWDKLDILK